MVNHQFKSSHSPSVKYKKKKNYILPWYLYVFMIYITMFCLLTNERFNHDQNFDNLDSDLRLIQLQESRIGALEGAQQIPRGFQLLLFRYKNPWKMMNI